MNTKKINKLTDELILGFLEGNLSKEDAKKIELLIKSNDENFARFSSMYTSYREFEDLELEVTPDALIKKAEVELGLTSKKAFQGKKKSILSVVLNEIKMLLQPRIAVYALISAALVIVTILAIYNQSEGEIEKKPKLDTELFNRLMSPDMRPVIHSSIEGIEVQLEQQVLIITQPFRFDREINIFLKNGKLILFDKFRDLEYKISLPESLMGDSILVVLTSLDTVVYRNVFGF